MKNLILLSLLILFIGCQSNPVIFEVENIKNQKSLELTDSKNFTIITEKEFKYLSYEELYKTNFINYKLGNTIGFKGNFYLKTMIREYKVNNVPVLQATLRSYDNEDTLIDEVELAKSYNDTLMSSWVYKNLMVKREINGKTDELKLSENGKFITIPEL